MRYARQCRVSTVIVYVVIRQSLALSHLLKSLREYSGQRGRIHVSSFGAAIDEAYRYEEALEEAGTFDASYQKFRERVGLLLGHLVLEPLSVHLDLDVEEGSTGLLHAGLGSDSIVSSCAGQLEDGGLAEELHVLEDDSRVELVFTGSLLTLRRLDEDELELRVLRGQVLEGQAEALKSHATLHGEREDELPCRFVFHRLGAEK